MSAAGAETVDEVRVVLVDDHPLFRAGMRLALDSGHDMRIVAEADTADAALGVLAETPADVVLMDLNLPDRPGVQVTQLLAAEYPALAVLVMTMAEDDEAIVAALRAGARGYLLKGAGRDEVLHAVRAVAHGGSAFSAEVAARLVALIGRPAPSRAPFPALSEREREVLDLVARGYNNRRIARELYLSDKTVRNHVSNLLGKLRAADRAEAIVQARQAGLGREPHRREALPTA